MSTTGHGRILWNERPSQPRSPGCVDEVVLRDVKVVHIEQMDKRCWWIGIYLDDDTTYWMGNFVANSRGEMHLVEQEESGIQWDRDQSHEEPR